MEKVLRLKSVCVGEATATLTAAAVDNALNTVTAPPLALIVEIPQRENGNNLKNKLYFTTKKKIKQNVLH